MEVRGIMHIAMVRTITLTTQLWLGCLFGLTLASDPVVFDVNPIVAAQPLPTQGWASTMANSRFVRIPLQLSSLIDSSLSNDVDEFLFRVETQHQEMQVADFFPKTELTSSVAGQVQVSSLEQEHRELNARGAAGYPGAGWVEGNAQYYGHAATQKAFIERPAMSVLTASGTLGRRSGVYFKFKRSPQTTLEGMHPVEVVMEVPSHWRGGLLDVSMEANGGGRSRKTLAQQRFLVAVYQAGDDIAEKVARGHVTMEQRLRWVEHQYAREIRKRNEPTPMHRIGVALDIMSPAIPDSWLSQVLFGKVTYPEGAMSKLPVDVRVAILDYIDHRQAMETLADAGRSTSYR